MYRDIESLVKSCKGCALVAWASPMNFNPWPETDRSWIHLHIDLLIHLMDNIIWSLWAVFSKWPETLRYKKLTTRVVLGFLHEFFARFGVPDSTVLDDATQFTSKEFKGFCKMFEVEHITLEANTKKKQSMYAFKKVPKKSKGGSKNTELQQFLRVYRLTPNKNMPSVIIDKVIRKKSNIRYKNWKKVYYWMY